MRKPKRDHNILLKKRLGQHLLVDTNYLEKIIKASQIGSRDNIFEIGAGSGNLTHRILQAANRVVAVEIDQSFKGALEGLKKRYGERLEILFGDVLSLDLFKTLGSEPAPWKVLANIPYYITSPLLDALLESGSPLFSDIFLTVQREIANRISAQAGESNNSSLTLFVLYYSVPRILFSIPRDAFNPPPRVESSFIHLKIRDTPPVPCPPELLFRVTRKAFGQRRKGIKNSLKGISPQLTDKDLAEILQGCSINPLQRPQDLSLHQFSMLALSINERESHGGNP